jgi:protein AbiQ
VGCLFLWRKNLKLFYLTESFYKSAINNIKEMEHKNNRPYAMVIIKIYNNTFAIPLRSGIKHNRCYETMKEDPKSVKGLDYSKALIVLSRDIDSRRKPTINQEEFNVLRGKERIIAEQFKKYLEDYREIIIKKQSGIKLYSIEETLIEFSTLQNYHVQIGI